MREGETNEAQRRNLSGFDRTDCRSEGQRATDVWDAVCDFGALHDRLVPGFVVDAQLDGTRRRIAFVSRRRRRQKSLVSVDDERHRLAYRVVESGLDSTTTKRPWRSPKRRAAARGSHGPADLLPRRSSSSIAAGLMDQGGAAMLRAFGH